MATMRSLSLPCLLVGGLMHAVLAVTPAAGSRRATRGSGLSVEDL